MGCRCLFKILFSFPSVIHPEVGFLDHVKVLVAQLCLTLCDPMVCSPPGSSAHGNLQARTLEWVAMPFSRGSSWPMNQTHVSFIAVWATRSYDSSIFNSLRNLHAFHGGCTNLHAHQQCAGVPFPSNSCLHFSSLVVSMRTILTGVKRYCGFDLDFPL